MTATDASRGFSELLDAVERGETVTITRGGREIAELRPAPRYTVGALVAALRELPPSDGNMGRDIAETLALLTPPDLSWIDDLEDP